VVELPPIRPVMVEAWQYAASCPGCGHRTKGTYPAGLEQTRTHSLRSGQAGPRVEALLAYRHERHHVGYERLVEVCRDLTPEASYHVIVPRRNADVIEGRSIMAPSLHAR
jgi:hypothetical protein